jgi:PucR C-terminal helix-turn-helix domain/GGDEF-like domain
VSSPMATVAELAVATGVQIATSPSRWEAVVTSVVDAEVARESVSLDGVLVIVDWRPVRPSDPLPDLPSLLEPLLVKNPSAILVNPARQVNPPRQTVTMAERADVCLLWNAVPDTGADVTSHLRRLVDPRPVNSPHAPTADEVATATGSDLLEILHRADNLENLLDAIGARLHATVRLSASSGALSAVTPVAVFPLTGVAQDNMALEVTRDTGLTVAETAMLDGLMPVIGLHVKLRASESDDAATEIARNLKSILGDDLVQREAGLRKGRRLALFPRHPVVCLGIEPFGVAVDMGGLHDLKSSLAPVATRFDADAITIVNEGVVVVLIKATTDFDALSRALYRGVQVPLAIGASDPVDNARSYPGAFRQAIRAVAVGRRIGAINRVTGYRDLGVLGVLYQLPEHARRQFVSETLGPVADETPDGLDQRRVLRVLRATDCNIAESARELFVHPNTLRSRIARIEAVTGPFLNEPDRRLTIFTALSMFSLDSNVEGD